MTRKVLLVDDEKNILDGFRRNLRKYDITTALGPLEGLEAIADDGPFAVVVSDLQMPQMDGIEFLQRVESEAPKSIRIMLTGQADVNVSIAAVNDGHVFRFLTKPCPPEVLAATLDDGIEQYRLVEAERQLLEETLKGAVEVLTEVLGLVDGNSQALAARVEATVAKMAKAAGVHGWQYGLAAMLSQLGNLTLPAETAHKLNRGAPLTAEEQAMAAEAPRVAYRLLERIPRLGDVAEIVKLHADPPDHDPGSDDVVTAGSNLVNVAVRYQRLMASDRSDGEIKTILENAASGDPFRQSLVASLFAESPTFEWQERTLHVRELKPGMVLSQIVRAHNGTMLLAEDQTLTAALLERLKVFAEGVGVEEPIRVQVQSDIPPLRQAS